MRSTTFSPIFSILGITLILSVAAAEPTQKVQIGAVNFQIPNGYHLEKIAGEDLVKWPVVVDWDCKGRLLVVESGGVASPIVEHNKKELHRIVRLTDTDSDGSYDSRQVVVDKLPFTEGVLFYDKAIYACAPPNIWKFTDKDEDEIFETREVWFDGQTVTYCANDLHGPYLGRDGWIYWCKGAFGQQTHELLDGKKMTSTAAHIYRRHPSGGAIEPVVSGGMDNPVEVANTRTGELFFTSTFLHHPGNGVRDGIAHGVYGGLFGKSHEVLDGHPRTGDLMPVMVELGPAAPSGLLCADRLHLLDEGDGIEHEYLIAALFNLQKVTAHKLVPDGASFKTENTDLVVGDRIDFHPTDVLQDGDGSLIIVDTGGWYDLCCPTSKIDQQTALGGIYRLSNDATQSQKNKIAKCPTDWSDVHPMWLTAFIHDSRPWVARTAMTQLTHLEEEAQKTAVDLLALQLGDASLPVNFRLDALWALSWINCGESCGESLRLATDVMNDSSPELVQAACHIAALHRNTHAVGDIVGLLEKSDSLAVKRSAAEALGRLGHKSAVEPLLKSLESETAANDRFFQHSVAYALIELADSEELFLAIDKNEYSSRALQAAIMAIEQLKVADRIDAKLLRSALASSDEPLSLLAASILGTQPNRVEEFAQWIDQSLAPQDEGQPLNPSVLKLIGAWKDTDQISELLRKRFDDAAKSKTELNRDLLKLIELFKQQPWPTVLDTPLAGLFNNIKEGDQLQLAAVLAGVDLDRSAEMKKALTQAASLTNDDYTAFVILKALPKNSELNEKLENRLVNALFSSTAAVNEAATEVLLRCKVSHKSAEKLNAQLDRLPPRSLAAAVTAIGRVESDDLNKALLTKLVSLPAAKTLNTDQIKNQYRNRDDSLKTLADVTIGKLTAPSQDIEAALQTRLAKLSKGDAAKGMQLFRSQKAACSSCHRVGYVGAEIGPELTRIGSSRTRAALLEAIMFPSARLEQSYRSTKVLTSDGHVYNGIVKRNIDAKRIELQVTADQAIVLNTDNIEEMGPSELSIMPTGISDLLSDEELSDLLAFLESAK